MAAERSQALDLRRAVPQDAYMAVYGKHNPERDYQREYWKEVWDTVQETQIIERAVKIVTDRLRDQDLEKAKSVLDELREAAEPMDLEAILDASEGVYAQRMRVPSGQRIRAPAAEHLFLMRMTPEAAAGMEQGFKNLFGLLEKYTQGKIPVQTAEEGDATITTLSVPEEVPFRPTIVRLDDVLLMSTSDELARGSLEMLVSGEAGKSKFDDPRLKEALSRLPEPEDSLVFYDGKLQFSQLRGMGDFIRQVSQGNPDAERVAELVELIFDEVAIMDYEVTVEYTEGNQNRSASYGKLVPGAEDKWLMRVLGSGKSFEEWKTWVPADALSYSLSTGVNLHEVYDGIMWVVERYVPDAQSALDQFDALQAEHDVYLDRDILQAFSGEVVSVSLPAAGLSMLGGQDSVTALRCHKPDRIRELLHRLVDLLQQNPFMKAQQVGLADSEELEGFEEVSAALLKAFGVSPVIGFRDGWMFIGSNAGAVQKVLDTKAGQTGTIAETEAFKRFNLEIEGPVDAISYTDLAASTRGAAQFLNQAGMIAPMIIAMAGAQADAEELKPVQEILGLLPSVAKIVSKLDFFQAKISVSQECDEPGCYMQRTVTVVRPESGS
jgi:hypothetical protein